MSSKNNKSGNWTWVIIAVAFVLIAETAWVVVTTIQPSKDTPQDSSTVQVVEQSNGTQNKVDPDSYIGENKAKEIALNDLNLKEDQTSNLRVYLDRDDGRVLYEIEFFSGDMEYDYEIDAVSGKILDFSHESIYD
jgi:uncharacterized membrane protein YkoI